MKRVAAQLIYCSPELILRHHAIELDDAGIIKNIFDLKSMPFETANTLFYNGIISTEIISAKHYLNETGLIKLMADRHYIDFSNHKSVLPLDANYNGIIDFGSNNSGEINRLLKINYNFFSELRIDQFINACCYLPQQLFKPASDLQISNKVRLLLWEGINLTTLQISPEIRITGI